jgi:hypothetical protein
MPVPDIDVATRPSASDDAVLASRDLLRDDNPESCAMHSPSATPGAGVVNERFVALSS